MSAKNQEIASRLNEIADLLDIEGANPFRIRAYRRAARLVSELPRDVTEMLEAGEDLDDLPWIGPDLADKIAALAQGKQLPMLIALERKTPPEISALLSIPGLGPKRVHQLHEALGIDSVEALSAAANTGKLRTVPGFGPQLEAMILRALATGGRAKPRMLLATAEQTAQPLLEMLRRVEGVHQVEIAGSYRRRLATVGDLDIVVAADDSVPVMRQFTSYEAVDGIVEQGDTRATVRLHDGLQVDLRVVRPLSFGAALCYFTGAKTHNIALRQIAIDRGLKLNEYGLHKRERLLAGRTEDELYKQLGLRFIPPELREDHGEIEAARQGQLPNLVTTQNIRGDLHMHTNATDGRSSLADMVAAARAKGYSYIAITDHSHRLRMAHGMDANRLMQQMDEIDRLNDGLTGFTILKSIEVDILEDGKLDLQDSILCRLDLVVGAIHSHFDLAQTAQTERILHAMDQKYFNILAHPTGRLLNKRQAYEMDMERVMRGALDRNCFLEINAQPERLDLNDIHCRMAKALGLKLAISTDAHSNLELNFMRFGVDQARRGWLEADDILNTRNLPQLLALLQQHH